MVTMCLDYGDRYVGVAITDPEGRIALRHSTIDQKSEPALKKIAAVVGDESVASVLVGVPLSLEGEETSQTHKTLTFIEKLRSALGERIVVEGVDEVFTSKEAQRLLRGEGGSREEEHAEAARLMLEHYLKQ